MSKRFTSVLDTLSVPAPCSEDWEAMRGNDQVRFCSHCALSVHNLSAMTRQQAKVLVKKSEGRLCVRYYRRPDGKVQAVTDKLHNIKRRASRIAAGAFSATLSLSASVAAQTSPTVEPSTATNIQVASWQAGKRPVEQSGPDVALAGTVIDPSGAVIPGATITLIDENTKQEQVGKTDDEGTFQFRALPSGNYSLKVESPGFQPKEINGLSLRPNEARQLELMLDIGAVAGGGMIALPIDAFVSAAFRDDLGKVKELLAAGADVNVIDPATDSTALMEAVDNGNTEMAQLLLSAGADVNAKNKAGRTALMVLDDETPAGIVSILITAGAKVNGKDESGNSPLLIAAGAKNVLVLQALLDAGAKVNATNEEGKTALMIAAEEGYFEIVTALLAAGAEVTNKSDEGKTALKLAQDNDYPEIIQLLEAHGAR